jgi:hypothetical protein
MVRNGKLFLSGPQEHTRYDEIEGGDSDDILEAGETLALEVFVRNVGSGILDAEGIVGYLWPTPPIIFDLDISGAYEPQNIYIGEQGAHPTDSTFAALEDTFRIPLNWEAIRSEGQPSLASINETSFAVWRDTTALWHVRGAFSTDADSVLTGLLYTAGGFDEVDCPTCETGQDTVIYSAMYADTVRFDFRRRTGGGDDLQFRADASNWLEVLTDSVRFDDMAGGETSSDFFEVAWSGLVPDNDLTVFTLAVRDTSYNWWFSDFFETVHAPNARNVVQDTVLVSDSGNRTCPKELRIWPTLANLGSATADTSAAILTKTAGSGTVQNDKVIFGAIAPGDTAEAEDYFSICGSGGSPFAGLEYTLEIRTYHPNGDSTTWSREGNDINPPDEPTELITDEAGGTVVLRWTGATAADIEGYHVFKYLPGDTTRLTRAAVVGTTRYEISGLEAYDEYNEYINYRYAVTTVDSSGNESSKVLSDTAWVWLPEVANWPKRLRSGSRCAPKVFDITGDGNLEIFAAGQKMYAWKYNGDPLISANEDGLFYDPNPNGVGAGHSLFVEALGIADIDNDGKTEVVGNIPPDSIIVVEYDPSGGGSVSREWARAVKSSFSAPIIEDLDGGTDNEYEIILASDDTWIRVWTCEGNTFRNEGTTDGKFVENPNDKEFVYRSLSVGEAVSGSDGKEIFQTVFKDTVVCYSTESYPGYTLWISDVPYASNELATPVLGDVDGDEEIEVVVSRRRDGIYKAAVVLFDGSTGSEEVYWGDDDYEFHVPSAPPPPVALADWDGDEILDIVVGGGEEGVDGVAPWANEIEVYLMRVSGGDLALETVRDSVMIPGRKFADIFTHQEPVVGDIDGDGNLECILPTNSGYLVSVDFT